MDNNYTQNRGANVDADALSATTAGKNMNANNKECSHPQMRMRTLATFLVNNEFSH